MADKVVTWTEYRILTIGEMIKKGFLDGDKEDLNKNLKLDDMNRAFRDEMHGVNWTVVRMLFEMINLSAEGLPKDVGTASLEISGPNHLSNAPCDQILTEATRVGWTDAVFTRAQEEGHWSYCGWKLKMNRPKEATPFVFTDVMIGYAVHQQRRRNDLNPYRFEIENKR